MLLLAVFGRSLAELAPYVTGVELHSQILLVPFIVGYLLYIHGHQLPKQYSSSVVPASAMLASGSGADAAVWAAAKGCER